MRTAGAQIPREKRLLPFISTTVQVGPCCLLRLLLTGLFPRLGGLLLLKPELLLGVAELGGLLKMLLGDRLFLLRANLLDFLGQVLDVGWPAQRGDAGAGTGLIHHVDGLVGQETSGDVTVGEFDRDLQGLVGEDGLVVILILGADALENGDGVLNGRRLHLHGLEAAIERALVNQGVLSTLGLQLLALLLADPGQNAGNANALLIQQAMLHIMENCHRALNMPQIARDLRIGYTRFRELFQEHAQTSPKQYQLKIRLERARELLRNTELPLKEIALRLGFHTAFHFSHQFRTHHQLSPSAWRKQGAALMPPSGVSPSVS